MKLLTPTELIELLPPDEQTLGNALRQFQRLELALPTSFRDRNHWRRAIAEGFSTATTVNFNGRPAYLVCYHLADDGGLWIDLVQAVDPHADITVLNTGLDILAAQHRCRYIRLATPRRGMVEVAQLFGYVPEAVQMVKGVQ